MPLALFGGAILLCFDGDSGFRSVSHLPNVPNEQEVLVNVSNFCQLCHEPDQPNDRPSSAQMRELIVELMEPFAAAVADHSPAHRYLKDILNYNNEPASVLDTVEVDRMIVSGDPERVLDIASAKFPEKIVSVSTASLPVACSTDLCFQAIHCHHATKEAIVAAHSQLQLGLRLVDYSIFTKS